MFFRSKNVESKRFVYDSVLNRVPSRMTIRFIRSEFRTNVARTICNFKNIYIIHSYSYLATKEFEIWTDLEQQPELKLSAILLFSSSLIAFVACERLELLKTEICVAVVAIRKLLVNFLGSFCVFLFFGQNLIILVTVSFVT